LSSVAIIVASVQLFVNALLLLDVVDHPTLALPPSTSLIPELKVSSSENEKLLPTVVVVPFVVSCRRIPVAATLQNGLAADRAR
jgi:hypothetical protein